MSWVDVDGETPRTNSVASTEGRRRGVTAQTQHDGMDTPDTNEETIHPTSWVGPEV